MSDIDYNYVITEDNCNDEDVVLVINDYYNNSDICEVCVPTGGTSIPDYAIVNDTREDPSIKFYNLDYAL